MIWVSFDLDFVTGDCRPAFINSRSCGLFRACVKKKIGCDGCGDPEIGRAIGCCTNRDSFETWNMMEDFIKSLDLEKVVVRDCHGDIFNFLKPGDIVYNYDEHTDDYDCDTELRELGCWNWVNYCETHGIKVAQVTEPVPISEPSSLFISISRPYTTTDYDGKIFNMLMDLEMPIDFYGGA